MQISFFCVVLSAAAVAAQDPLPVRGPFPVRHETVSSSLFDSTDQELEIWYPHSSTGDVKHPLISYAHGMSGGGVLLAPGYFQLLNGLASFGYVIVAPRACNLGCADDTTSLPRDPPRFGHWYKQQLLAIDWAMNTTNPFHDRIAWDIGVGIAGHSMGGQATMFSGAVPGDPPGRHNIKASVLHFAYTHEHKAPTVPALYITGAKDTTAPPAMTEAIYELDAGTNPKVFANKAEAGHHAPDTLGYDPLLSQFTAAWFKLYLDATPQWEGFDFHEMIYGDGKSSLCNGGFGAMVPGGCKL